MNRKSMIFIFGHRDLVGSGIVRYLKKEGFVNLILADQSEVKFTDQKSVYSFFKKEKPDYCVLTPIKEGGIGANIAYPAELIYRNLAIQTNIIDAAYKTKVKKLLFFASSCVYPAECPQPMKEEYLLTGPLEITNEPYAIAKIAGIKMCQAYNKQYGTRFISAIPATVFGPNDNFDFKTSHVISVLIRKFHEAKIKKETKVSVWGSGKPLREFLYKDDVVRACFFLMDNYHDSEIINVGYGQDISIKELALLIKDIVGFKGEIIFDKSKPDGTHQKLLDINKIKRLGWRPRIPLREGIVKTYAWFKTSVH